VLFSTCILKLTSQNEAKKWCFGSNAGLDFTTSPPTAITSSSINTPAGCASIADASGNLLFYTNGITIWNQNHATMANGTGLTGFTGATQNSIIIKKPGGGTIYYVFTTGGPSGLAYSIVDMSLSSGTGSVTSKNNTLVASSYSEKIAATKHCNGTDIWVVARDAVWSTFNNSNGLVNFTSFLVTSAGINTVAVLSPANTWTVNSLNGYYDYGCMKISPNGKKLGLASGNWWANSNFQVNTTFELYDFNASTGVVSNSLGLNPTAWNINSNVWNSYGVEFSPDGTKFYGSTPGYWSGNNYYGSIMQWDLCAGSPTAIAASQYTVSNNFSSVNFNGTPASMQVAPDGKIYVSQYGVQSLGIINNPNLAGAACNYSQNAISIAPRVNYYGLPNFMSSYLSQTVALQPFTFTVNPASSCLTASFTAPANPTFVCSGNTLSGYQWIFGDPQSGSANTSTLTNPTHNYPTPGTYTAKLVYNYTCGSDTISLPVSIIGASLTLNTASITCASLGSATVTASGGIGPYSYTWTPTAQTTSVATGLNPGTYSITVVDNGGNCAFTATTAFTSLVPFTGIVANSPSIACNGVKTGTANIPVSGGSGNNIYYWTDGVTTQTTAMAVGLGAGIHTVSVTDALTFCNVTQFFFISQPPALNPVIAASAATVCAGGSISFTASNSGGVPGPGAGYTYSWTGGPTTDTFTSTQSVAGNYTYTVSSRDGNNCLSTQTVLAGYIVNPVLSVPAVSICPLKTGTLVASGATSYTWSPTGTNGNTLSASPLVTTVYTVTGSAAGCNSVPKTATIVLKSVPVPTLTSNSPVCNGTALSMTATGGSSYNWTGPLGFSSFVQSPVINPAAPNRSGVYNVTVTAANSCTAPASLTLTVHPTPTISIAGSTVCVTQTLNLFSNTFVGSTFNWTGPASFTSAVQNPTVLNPGTNLSGTYNLTVTSAQNCTNTASVNAQVVALPVPSITANYTAMCFGSTLSLAGSGGNNYNWSGPNGFNSNLQNTGILNVTLPANGVYTLVVTTGPCVVSTTKSITIYPLPNPTATYIPTCETKLLQLTSSGGGGTLFAWSGPSSFTSSVQNPVINYASQANSGLYNLMVTDGNNCKASTSVFVNILSNPNVTSTGATVCFSYPAALTASGAVTYTWTGPNGYYSVSSTANIPSANSGATQSYTVTGTAANSCTNTSIALLQTNQLPVPSLTVTSRACLNDTINLAGEGGSTYAWTGPNHFYSSRQRLTFTASNIAYSGLYTLTVADAIGCKNQKTTLIIIDPAPEVDLSGTSVNHCIPFCSDYVLIQKNESPILNAEWQVNNRFYNSPGFNFCTNTAGRYIASGTFTNAAGCVSTQSFEIKAYPVPEANFEFFPQTPMENIDEVKFTNYSKGESITGSKWHFINNNDYRAFTTNVSHVFENAGTWPVSLIVTNAWGCADTIIKTVTVDNDFLIFVPNSFTPNDDNINDLFFAKGLGIVNYSIAVFDRWGARVFQTTDISKGWDGTFQGQECKSDVYVWKLKATDVNGKTKDLNGFVTLYR